MAHKGSAGTITKPSSLMNLEKAGKPMVSIVGARCFAPGMGHAQRAPTLQGAQKIIGGHFMNCPNGCAATTKLQRNPAPSVTDGLFTRPSNFSLKNSGHRV